MERAYYLNDFFQIGKSVCGLKMNDGKAFVLLVSALVGSYRGLCVYIYILKVPIDFVE